VGAGVAGSGVAGSGVAVAGAGPAVGSGGAATGDITIWLAGDSTVAKGNTPCPVGWGAALQALFKPQAKVVNSAVGGRSVRTWLYEVQTQMDSSGECALNKDSSGEPVLQMRWQAMLDGMKDGDYLFIQFGINDSSRTCDRHVGIEAFKESYGMMAMAAKERGAQPVFVTPVSAIACEGSTARPTRGEFVTATIDAGKTFDVPVIDLHERSIAIYNELGLCPIPGGSDVSASTGGKVGELFCDDHTHFSSSGAAQIAQLMAAAIQDQSLGLAAYLQ
jgi:lysophospholipase L1-like esterase